MAGTQLFSVVNLVVNSIIVLVPSAHPWSRQTPMAGGEPRVYELRCLEVFNELADWVYVRDMNPRSLKMYWGNDKIRKAFNLTSQAEFLRAPHGATTTSQKMLEWSQEVYEEVQVRGKSVTRRRTLYPCGEPHVMDLSFTQVHVRVPTGENDETEVKVLALIHGKRVEVQDQAQLEANRAAMLLNHAKDAIVLLRGPGAPDDHDARGAFFANMRARRRYAIEVQVDVEGGDASAAQGKNQETITLDRVLDSCDFESNEERLALRAKISGLQLGDGAVVLEAKACAHMRGSGGEGLQKLPLHRRIEFAPVTDPVSGTMSVMVTEDDISHIKAALEELKASREQSSKLLYSMLPDYVADHLCQGRRVPARHHSMVSILFADIVGFTSMCSRSSPRQICVMLNELYTGLCVNVCVCVCVCLYIYIYMCALRQAGALCPYMRVLRVRRPIARSAIGRRTLCVCTNPRVCVDRRPEHSPANRSSSKPLFGTVMDCAASFFSVHKIETIGDSYMAAGGLFQTDDKTQSDDVCHSVDMAFAMCVPAIVYACLHSGLCVRPLTCVYGHLVAVAWAPFALSVFLLMLCAFTQDQGCRAGSDTHFPEAVGRFVVWFGDECRGGRAKVEREPQFTS